MTWNWEQADWPNFSYNSEALVPLEQQFLLQSGEFVGACKHIGADAQETLKIELISEEAVKTSEILAEMPDGEPALEGLESIAIERRLDLAAARAEREVVAGLLSTARGTRYFPAVQVGVASQRETPEGIRSTGPTLSLELPIFDQGQARLERLEAQARQAEARVDDLAVRVRSEVRSARSRLIQQRALVGFYRRSVLPVRERILQQTQFQYNAMQIGLPQLLHARQNQTNGYRDYVEGLRDYWMARSDLELAVGGRLASGPKP